MSKKIVYECDACGDETDPEFLWTVRVTASQPRIRKNTQGRPEIPIRKDKWPKAEVCKKCLTKGNVTLTITSWTKLASDIKSKTKGKRR